MIPTNTPLVLASEYKRIVNTDTSTNIPLTENIRWGILSASNFLQRECGLRRFDEWYEIRPFTCLDERIGGALLNPYTLQLDTDLRTPIAIKNGNQDTIALTNIILLPGGLDVGGVYDIRQIRIKQFSGVFWFSAGFDPYQAITVEGRWGYGGQWVNSGTTLKASTVVAPTDTTIQLTDPTKVENTMVLKIINSSVTPNVIEYMYLDSETTINPLTVGRGFNGSIPTSFLGGETVYYWQADIGIRQLVTRLTQFYFAQIKSPVMGQITLGDLSFPVNMSGLPADLFRAIRDLGYVKTDGGVGI